MKKLTQAKSKKAQKKPFNGNPNHLVLNIDASKIHLFGKTKELVCLEYFNEIKGLCALFNSEFDRTGKKDKSIFSLIHETNDELNEMLDIFSNEITKKTIKDNKLNKKQVLSIELEEDEFLHEIA